MSLKPAEEKLLALHPCQQGGVGTVAGIDFGQRLPRQLGKDFGCREFEAEPDDKAVQTVCLRLFCVDPEFVQNVSRGAFKLGTIVRRDHVLPQMKARPLVAAEKPEPLTFERAALRCDAEEKRVVSSAGKEKGVTRTERSCGVDW